MSSSDIPSAAKSLRDQIHGLRPELTRLRSRTLSLFLIITLVLVSGITGGLFAFYPHMQAIFLPAVSVPLLLSFGLFRISDMLYRREVRKRLIETLTFSSGFTHKPGGFFKTADLIDHALLPSSNTASAGDGFSGEYNNAPLTLQDMDLIRHGAVHNGLAVRVRLKRPVDAHTIVFTQNAVKAFFAGRFADYGKIGTPNGKFDKQVDVFTTDRSEARLLVDAALMELFMAAGVTLKASWAGVSFRGPEIMFLFARACPLIDPPPLWSSIKLMTMQGIYEQFEIFFKIVDVLRANRQVALS